MKHMMHEEVLQSVKDRCPGWVYALVKSELAPEPDAPPPSSPTPEPGFARARSEEALWQWAKTDLPITIEVAGMDNPPPSISVAKQVQIPLAIRQASLACPGAPLIARRGAETVRLSAQMIKAADRVVPSSGPANAPVAFVAYVPSWTDTARAEPLTGADGRCLFDQYLAPLGLAKSDVLLTYAYPVGRADHPSPSDKVQWAGWVHEELRKFRPRVTVALGKHAKEVLGLMADFTLPHPAAVRKSGDTDQLVRKLRNIRDEIEKRTRDALCIDVHICGHETLINKATDEDIRRAAEKRIVYGVVLSPIGRDLQGDYTPPSEIEATAHDYLANSRMVGLEHEWVAPATVVESWLWPYPSEEDYRKAMAGEPHSSYAAKFGTDVVHSGAWVMATRIENDEIWESIVNGDITAYSIGGTGIRLPSTSSDMPEVTFINA
jgi:uracil-DNA glycosylase family 4